MNPAGKVHFTEICRRNNAEADAILAKHAAGDHRRATTLADHHVWPSALPDIPAWHQQPPVKPGRYRWRMSGQWEEVVRALDPEGFVWSYRFQQPVSATRLGGEWFY